MTHTFELNELSSVFQKMVATNQTTWTLSVGSKQASPSREYTIEEINRIIASGDIGA